MMMGAPQIPMGDYTQPGMSLPQSMPGGMMGQRGMGPMQGAAMGALGGALRGMTPRMPDPSVLNALGGGAINPQLLAALLGR